MAGALFNLWRKILNILSERLNRIMKRHFTCQWFFHLTFAHSLSSQPFSCASFLCVWPTLLFVQHRRSLVCSPTNTSHSLRSLHLSFIRRTQMLELLGKHRRVRSTLSISHHRYRFVFPANNMDFIIILVWWLWRAAVHIHILVSIPCFSQLICHIDFWLNANSRIRRMEDSVRQYRKQYIQWSVRLPVSHFQTTLSQAIVAKRCYTEFSHRFCQVEKHYFIIRQQKATTDGITSMSSAHRRSSTAEWSNSDSGNSSYRRHHRTVKVNSDESGEREEKIT